MIQGNTAQGLLILIASPDLEEMLVDMLLQQKKIPGFTTSNVSGHGTGHADAALSLVEQVTGRQKRVQFLMQATVADLHELITELKTRFKNTDLHYILLPVLEMQEI